MNNKIELINELINDFNIDVITVKSIISKLDNFTIRHIIGTRNLSKSFGDYLSLTDNEIKDLMNGALLHDIGKVIVPKEILLKNGCLDDKEFKVMKDHVINAKILLGELDLNKNISDVIYQHHEKIDGSGYPYNLCGNDINRLAKIFSLIDVYDALINERPYKKAFSKFETLNIISNGLGNHFDAELGAKFISFINYCTFDKNRELRKVNKKELAWQKTNSWKV